METKYGFLLLTILTTMGLASQNLRKHKWKDRVVLIISNNDKTKIFKNQVNDFNIESRDFRERKLVVYKVFPKKYKITNDEHKVWVNDTSLFTTYNAENEKFKVLLIGLDGRIKIEKQAILTSEELFSAIDAMPMRRAEKQKNDN